MLVCGVFAIFNKAFVLAQSIDDEAGKMSGFDLHLNFQATAQIDDDIR